MAIADFRAVVAGLVVGAVALFGEVGWPLVYLFSGLAFSVTAAATAADRQLRIRNVEWLWLGLLAWSVIAAVFVSGSALASKTTLASWAAAWLVWTVVAKAGPSGRRVVSAFLVVGAVVLGGSIVGVIFGLPPLITNPNVAVALIVSAVPLTTGYMRNPLKTGVVMALMLVPVLMTGSRAGVLAVLGIGLAFWPPGRHRWWGMSLGGIAAAAAIVWRLVSRPESLAWHRWKIWGAIIESVGDRPLLGIGAAELGQSMGPYRLEHAAEIGRWGHVVGSAENMVFGLVVRIGLPGMALAAATVLVWAVTRRRPGISTNAVVIATTILALFHDFCSEPAVLWWWAAVFGVLTLRDREIEDRKISGVGLPRKAAVLAIGGIAVWALVQPAWGQWLWRHHGPSPEAVVAAVKAEPWFAQPLRWRIENLLGEKSWTWSEASQALAFSHRHLAVHRGSAEAWGLHAKVNMKIVDLTGAWPATVDNARTAFTRAIELEPHLPWYPYEWALMERGLGNTEEAVRLVSRSLDSEPAFVRGWLLLARLNLDQGQLREARAALERGLSARGDGEPKAGIDYHHDLLRCPEWQLQEIRRELE